MVRVIRLVSRLFLQKGNRSFGLRFPKNTVKRTAESDDQEICGIWTKLVLTVPREGNSVSVSGLLGTDKVQLGHEITTYSHVFSLGTLTTSMSPSFQHVKNRIIIIQNGQQFFEKAHPRFSILTCSMLTIKKKVKQIIVTSVGFKTRDT